MRNTLTLSLEDMVKLAQGVLRFDDSSNDAKVRGLQGYSYL